MNIFQDESFLVIGEIVNAADKQAENAAWDKFINRYDNLINIIASQNGGVNPRELISDLYLHLRGNKGDWKRLKSCKAKNAASFKAWLTVVTNRLVYEKFHSNIKVINKEIENGVNEESKIIERVVALQMIQSLRHPICRVLIRKRHFMNLNFNDIALELNISTENARQMHHRNMNELFERIKRFSDEC